MNVFALFSLCTSVIAFFLGVFIYSKDSRNNENRLFMGFCLILAYLSFIEFEWRQAESFTEAYFWLQMSFLWPFLTSFLLHFVLEFTEYLKRLKTKTIYLFLYVPAVIFSFLDLISQTVSPVETLWGWEYSFTGNPLLLLTELLWDTGLSILSVYLLLLYHLKLMDQSKKIQTKYILIGLLIPLVGTFTEIMFTVVSIRIPVLSNTSFILGVIFIGYAMVKYELFSLTPATASANIIDTMSDVMLLINPEQKIISVNKATIKLLGYREKELINQPVDTIFVGKKENPILFGKRFAEHIRKNNLSDKEVFFKTKEGSTIPISLSTSILRDNAGNQKGIILIGRNIIERKKIEEALRKSEELYRMLFDSAKDAIFLYGLTSKGYPSKFLEVNKIACQKLGYTHEEMLELKPTDIIDPDFQHNMPQIMIRLMTKKNVLFEEIHVTKDGRKIPVEVNAYLFELNGQPTVLSIVRNIKVRKKSEKAILKSELRYRKIYELSRDGIACMNMQGRFLEFNQPYADIVGYSIDELYNINYWDLMQSIWRKKTEKILEEQVFKCGYSDVFEKEYIKKDGTVCPISIKIITFNDKNSDPTEIWVIVRNMTEHNELERQPNENTEKKRTSEHS